MQTTRKFLITTVNNPDGVMYSYDATTGLFVGVEIIQKNIEVSATKNIIQSLRLDINLFLSWAKTFSTIAGCEVVELDEKITFEMLWNLYDDKLRSSKKRSTAIWDKMTVAEQVKAYYFVYKYFRHRGNAEKKYLETYLRAELWNN